MYGLLTRKEDMKGNPAYLVIPAAGLGTRMRDVHPGLPKEMLPVGKKPAIQYAVEEAFTAGIENIVIIINREKEIVRRYFEDSVFRKTLFPLAAREVDVIQKRCSITFLYQKKPLGESDAIGLAEHLVGNNSLAVMYPDNIYFPSPGILKILTPVFNCYSKDVAALMEVTEENACCISNSGRVDITHVENNIYRIDQFLPKTAGNFTLRFLKELRSCGISISGPHLFEYIKNLKHSIQEREFTDLPVKSAILEDKGMLGYKIPGTVFDTGNPKGYELCLNYVSNFR
jgi:UTP--glucose-1-phosphate uridylyltransferase